MDSVLSVAWAWQGEYLLKTARRWPRQRSPYLMIFDEADRLRVDCFEMLRDLWDDARLPMLLVGNKEAGFKD